MLRAFLDKLVALVFGPVRTAEIKIPARTGPAGPPALTGGPIGPGHAPPSKTAAPASGKGQGSSALEALAKKNAVAAAKKVAAALAAGATPEAALSGALPSIGPGAVFAFDVAAFALAIDSLLGGTQADQLGEAIGNFTGTNMWGNLSPKQQAAYKASLTGKISNLAYLQTINPQLYTPQTIMTIHRMTPPNADWQGDIYDEASGEYKPVDDIRAQRGIPDATAHFRDGTEPLF